LQQSHDGDGRTFLPPGQDWPGWHFVRLVRLKHLWFCRTLGD
jgi:hypothetical protein